MTDDSPRPPRALVVLTSIAVAASTIIALNSHLERDTLLPMSIIAAGGLIGLGLAARR